MTMIITIDLEVGKVFFFPDRTLPDRTNQTMDIPPVDGAFGALPRRDGVKNSHGGTRKWMVSIGKSYENMDELGVALFMETTIPTYLFINILWIYLYS